MEQFWHKITDWLYEPGVLKAGLAGGLGGMLFGTTLYMICKLTGVL